MATDLAGLNNALLPCPFCGGNGKIEKDEDDAGRIRFYVFCTGCLMETMFMATPEAAADKWSKRFKRTKYIKIDRDERLIIEIKEDSIEESK